MANTDKTKAELYREERKARLAKAAKKRSKKKMGNGLKAVISVLVVIAIALGVCGYSFVSLGVSRQMQDVLEIADVTNISYAEYQYYYNQTYSYYFNNAAQYEQYYASYYGEGAGAMMMGGFDYTQSPELQKLPESHTDYEAVVEAGYEEPTWADYFDYVTRFQIAQMKVLTKMAADAGYKLDAEGKKDASDAYGQMKQAAGQAMTTVNKYLSIYYGKGVTKGLIKKIINDQTIAQHYQEVLKNEYRDALSAEDIQKNYEENKTQYDVASVAYYTVSAEKVKTTDEEGEETESVTSKTMKAAKEAAQELASAKNYKELASKVKAIKGELQDMNGITADTMAQYMGQEAANWLFSSKVKVGDTKVVEQSGAGYVVLVATAVPARDDTKMVTIRQIEIAIPEEEEVAELDEDATEEEIAKAEEAAEAAKKAAEEAAKKLAEDDAAAPALDTFKDAPVYSSVADKTSDKDTYLKTEILLRQYLAGENTEENFKAIADKQAEADPTAEDYNDTSLVENIYPNAGNVDGEVEAWALDSSRKAGDVGIIECEGEAYYLVYFVGTGDEAYWEMNVKDALAFEHIDNDIKSHETKVLDEAKIQDVIDTTMAFAKRQIAAVQSSQSASY